MLSLAERHGNEILEQACAKALSYTPRPSYKTIKSLISQMASETAEDPDEGAYLRGNGYYRDFDHSGDEKGGRR